MFLLYGQLIGYCFAVSMGVVEEKSTRVVEVLLAAVRPLQLLAGKIIGIGLVEVIQLAEIIGAVGLAVAVASNAITLPPDAAGTISSVLLWFLLGCAFSTCSRSPGRSCPVRRRLQNTAAPLTS